MFPFEFPTPVFEIPCNSFRYSSFAIPNSPFVLALGSNVGDRLANLNRAARALERSGATTVKRSRLYMTRPFGLAESSAGQAWYLNAAIAVASPLGPIELMDRCLAIESAMGRVRRERWEPRVIDIDLVFWGGARIDHPRLELPHPRWSERDFVVAPLIDLGVCVPDGFLPPGRRNLLDCLAAAERCIENVRSWT